VYMALCDIIENTANQNAENRCINTSYVVLLSGIPWNVQRATCIFFVCEENTSDKWDILWYITKNLSIVCIYF